MHRFFSEHPLDEREVLLEGDEAHHLARVLRLGPGDKVLLFDGSGVECIARVQQVSRHHVQLEIVHRERPDREVLWPVHAGVALPKGERQRWLVEKAVELGVTRLVLIRATRTVAEPLPTVVKRLQRYVIEACKQCGRTRLMTIDVAENAHTFFRHPPLHARRWLAHPHPEALPLESVVRSAPAELFARETWFAVGPEGGWEQAEVETALRYGWRPINLGPRILRVETAVCVLAVAASL